MGTNLSGVLPLPLAKVYHMGDMSERSKAELLVEIDRLRKHVTDLETVIRLLEDENAELTKIQAWLQEEAHLLVEESQALALVDPLTDIPNRRALHGLLHRRLNAPDADKTPLAYAILDLDDLKQINDSDGHTKGDTALKKCADTLRKLLHDGDILARYGGDEFVLVLDGADRSNVTEEIQRLLEALRQEGLKASIGVAFFPENGIDEATLFNAADAALYEAKNGGKDSFGFSV